DREVGDAGGGVPRAQQRVELKRLVRVGLAPRAVARGDGEERGLELVEERDDRWDMRCGELRGRARLEALDIDVARAPVQRAERAQERGCVGRRVADRRAQREDVREPLAVMGRGESTRPLELRRVVWRERAKYVHFSRRLVC
ncbi:MAG: hypothetical protein KC468_36175, partial [Myxococcales bacterium]|nr:hypothetical protein [Myxococcales bacterium]